MRIVVDLGLCQGHGVCESEAPGIFRVSKEEGVVEIIEASPSEARRAEVEMAVKYCPTQALRIIQDAPEAPRVTSDAPKAPPVTGEDA